MLSNQPGEGIEENERYIRQCRDDGDGQMAALFGLHALMTLGDDRQVVATAIAGRLYGY